MAGGSQTTNARGRPSKYDPDYCVQVIEHCATGASLTSFAAEIDVCRDTITEWANTHDDFSAAVKRAKAKCAAWWEKQNRALTTGGSGNATSCIFGLKNMAPDDWREKTETVHTGAVPVSIIKEHIVDAGGPA